MLHTASLVLYRSSGAPPADCWPGIFPVTVYFSGHGELGIDEEINTMSETVMKQYVLLPPRGLRAKGAATTASIASFLLPLAGSIGGGISSFATAARSADVKMKVLDSIHEDGAKLVEMSEEDAITLRRSRPDMKIAPVVYYDRALQPRYSVRAVAAPLSAQGVAVGGTLSLRILDSVTGNGVAGAHVVAFTDFANRFGAEGTSDGGGHVSLDFDGATTVALDRLYVYSPLAGYWGAYREQLTIATGDEFGIAPIEFTIVDGVRHFHAEGAPTDGKGVKVAVIDTGCGPHPDLRVDGAQRDEDNGEGHGTHVAGIIAASGKSPAGISGIAPGVELSSYRVFGSHALAANFTIAKAIDQATLSGCDLLNLSLKIDDKNDPSGYVIDPVVQAALEDARDAGTLPICAAGNDERTAVDFPGRDPMCLAVSAMGRIGTFPAGSIAESDIAPPFGADKNDFIASFSNVGPELDLTGPGVGIVSTVPGGYGVMSGTSMACPAVTGMVARLLSKEAAILGMPRDAQRSAAIARLALQAAASLGFSTDFEGAGMIR